MDGSTVISRLNEDLLREVAHTAKGAYVRANNMEAGLDKIFESFTRLEKKEYQSRLFSDYEDRFQYFLLIAVVLICIEIILAERKPKWAGKINLFGKKE
jgi:Ca-activated chloride channel family protein